jgi:hypothetical protein
MAPFKSRKRRNSLALTNDLESLCSSPTTTAPLAVPPARDLYVTLIEEHAAKSIRLLYRDGSWSGDGVSVSQTAVLVDGSYYPIQSRTPFYAGLTHHGRRIVITE